jgi:tRNA(Ile)-lysidine synthetase-like protein
MEQFYQDWFKNSQYWFNQNNEFDNYLSKNYGYLIDYYKNDYKSIYGVLIYDQLTRHYYRKEEAKHIITYFNRKALELVNKELANLDNYTYDEWMFFILVLRHTNERQYLLYAMIEAWKRGSKSFLKATYNRANFKEELEFYDCSKDYYNYYDFNREILDFNPDEEILNETNNYLGNYSKIKNNNNPIIVSLSGGVDSISCLYAMVKLYGNKKIIAVHINYNNRTETEYECDFLIWFCSKLKIHLYIRTIREIQRQQAINNDMREVYENYTKRVRFNSYRKAYELEGGVGIPIVILGHNKDDCLENILTNIAYKNKYDNLNGIEMSMIIDNINFYRPIIEISKKEIYNYAYNHNLPYLKNSTPDWCQRGKIRTSVVPILEKWDMRIIDGLFNMTSILQDLHLNLYMTINNNFKIKDEIMISNLNTSILYWKYGIFKIFNFYASNKSLNALIERLNLFKDNYNLKEINKKTKIIINKSLYLALCKSKNKNHIKYEFIIDNNNN